MGGKGDVFMELLCSQMDESTAVLCSLSIILFMGFIVTRNTKRLKLPNVSGYIIAGVLIRSVLLKDGAVGYSGGHMGFMSDIALAFIAFGVGKFLRRKLLRKQGSR